MRNLFTCLLVFAFPFLTNAQMTEGLDHIGTIDFGNPDSTVSEIFPTEAGYTYKIVNLGVLCDMTVLFEDRSMLRFISLDGTSMVTTGGKRQAGFSSPAPYTLASRVYSIECTCPPGRYATVGIYKPR